jgi:hypothetical protein
MSALPDDAPALAAELDPAFFSKTFQNLRDSSAAVSLLDFVICILFWRSLTCSSEHLSIWAETAVKDSCLVGWDLNIANQCWVAPDADGVVWETAGADDLTVVRAPSKAGDLRASINAVDTSAGSRVPEVDVTIIRSTTGSKKVWLPWAPAESLDRSLVVGLGELWDSQGASIPD